MATLQDLLGPIESSIVEADERVLGRCMAMRYVFLGMATVAVFTTPDRLIVQKVKRKSNGDYEARGEQISIVPRQIARARAMRPSAFQIRWSRNIPESILNGVDARLKIRTTDRQTISLGMGKISGPGDEQRRGVEAIGKWFASHADQLPTT